MDLKPLQGLLWPRSPSQCPWGDPQVQGEACGHSSCLHCGEACGSQWGEAGGFWGEEVSHPTVASATGKIEMWFSVSSEIRLSWFKPWLLLSDSWSISFLDS